MEIRRLRAADIGRSWELDRECFNASEDQQGLYQRFADPSELVGAFEGEALLAQSRAFRFGQFFGGRSVPMGGLSSVSTAPQARGLGLAKRVIRGCLDLMQRRGDAISCLYPATTELYRKLGWELAGAVAFRSVAPSLLEGLPRPEGLRLRRADLEDWPRLRGCYEVLAPTVNGFLDRTDRFWEACRARWEGARVFLAESPEGRCLGYLVYREVGDEWAALGAPFRLVVEDHVAIHPDASLGLWRLLGSWAAQVQEIVYRSTPEDPLFLLLPEQRLKALEEVRFMLRVVDAERAVAARGYAPDLGLRVGLELEDAILPANSGAYRLHVEKGRARLERVSAGTGQGPRLDVRGFAALYTGWASCATLERAGLLRGGSGEERARLDAAFAGPTPWLLDHF